MIGTLREQILGWFLYFTATSFLGWMVESAYRSAVERRPVNSGFLSGPFVPIYGFGALAIAGLARLLAGAHGGVYWIALVAAPTVLEYAASYFLEKAFGLRLWDYRKEAFNLRGRVCLLYSGFWAVLTVLAVYLIQPFLVGKIGGVESHARYFLSGAFSMYFLMDTIGSSRALFNFKAFIADLKELIARGGSFIPSLEQEAKKLPREFRRLLKPLRAFPHLGGQLNQLRTGIPEWISARLEKVLGGRHFLR